VVIKYSFATLLDETYDTCDLLEDFGGHCPVPIGTVLMYQDNLCDVLSQR